MRKGGIVAEADDLTEELIPYEDLVPPTDRGAMGKSSVDILLVLSDSSSDFRKFCL